MTDSLHKEMARKGIFRAGTETPLTLTGHTTQARYDFTVRMLRNAWENGVPLTFSTDADYWVPGMTRGELVRNLSVETSFSALACKSGLLPVWLAAYEYRGRSFVYAVNGDGRL